MKDLRDIDSEKLGMSYLILRDTGSIKGHLSYFNFGLVYLYENNLLPHLLLKNRLQE